MKEEQNGNDGIQLNVEYLKSSNYLETYATGFWGGMNHVGKVQISFYEDQLDMPLKSILHLEKNGAFKSEDIIQNDDNKKRVIKCTVTFDLDKLESFKEWIDGRIEDIKKIEAERLKNEQ